MKKEEVKVLINSKKEAKQAKAILQGLGEDISKVFYKGNNTNESEMFYSISDKAWLCYKCGDSQNLKFVSIKELIIILTQQLEMPKSILDGKVAIKVNNEREFKLLMEHYEGKGWVSTEGNDITKFDSDFYCYFKPKSASYNDGYYFTTIKTGPDNEHNNNGYKIISFEEFAKEVRIEVPVFVMTSEDGKPMYKDDKYVAVYLKTCNQQWYIGGIDCPMFEACSSITSPIDSKAFSTKEAAEKWILEANKPKEINISYIQDCNAIINKSEVSFIRLGKSAWVSTKEEIEEIYKTLQKLNS